MVEWIEDFRQFDNIAILMQLEVRVTKARFVFFANKYYLWISGFCFCSASLQRTGPREGEYEVV